MHSSTDSPSGPHFSSGLTPSPSTENHAATPSAQFRFPLPFDPIRLLAGVLSRWPWIAVGALLFGTLGTILGVKITHPSFSISASLIKRRVPQTVQTSEIGQAYRPGDLNDATLLATLLASEPLDLALKRSQNPISPADIKSFVEANQLEGTDIFYITYRSPVSPQDAISFTSLWAEEINAYTQRLQQTEAHEVRLILQKEVAELEQKIEATDLEILNFSKEKDYLGGIAQVSAALVKLAQIELHLETARTTAQTKTQQLENLTEQLKRQSPIESQLKTAGEELANLRATYTDANPLVQAKLQSIEYFSSQIKTLSQKGEAELDSYTGTQLGNQLYLAILDIRNELLDANSQIIALEKLYDSTSSRIAEFPAIISTYDAFQKKREALAEGLSLMSNRRKEAEIFASGAPGYWQVFQAPDPRGITPSSLIKKPIILGTASACAGAGLAVMLTLLLTQRSARRSILECCAATQAPLLCNIPTTFEEDAAAAVSHFWITHLSPRSKTASPILIWTSALESNEERRLWNLLASAAQLDTGHQLQVHDLTPDSLWNDSEHHDSLDWISSLPPPDPDLSKAILLRASALPLREAREWLAHVNHWISAVSGEKKSISRTLVARPLSDAYLPPCAGTIAWTERPDGRIRATADQVSSYLAKKFS